MLSADFKLEDAMRPLIMLTLCAFASTAAAAQPEQRSPTGGRFYMDIGGHNQGYLSRVDSGGTATVDDKHKDQIEILSWSWGESAPIAPGGTAKFGAVSGMHRNSGMKESGEKGGTEDLNIGVGELQEAGKQPTTTQKMLAPGATRPTRATASGVLTEKRQHGWVTVSKPLDRGAVRVRVRSPWAGCAVGARYPMLTVGGGAETYELTDAVIASCGDADRPTEEVAFNYSKIQVRGWDPATKKE